jgi:hypothetical protein
VREDMIVSTARQSKGTGEKSGPFDTLINIRVEERGENVLSLRVGRVYSAYILASPATTFVSVVGLALYMPFSGQSLDIGLVVACLVCLAALAGSAMWLRHVCGYLNDMEIDRRDGKVTVRCLAPFLRRKVSAYKAKDFKRIWFQADTLSGWFLFGDYGSPIFPSCLMFELKDGGKVGMLELGWMPEGARDDQFETHLAIAGTLDVPYRILRGGKYEDNYPSA